MQNIQKRLKYEGAFELTYVDRYVASLLACACLSVPLSRNSVVKARESMTQRLFNSDQDEITVSNEAEYEEAFRVQVLHNEAAMGALNLDVRISPHRFE